ncbi:flavin reductase family protein [Chitinolyticbacter albus]|uniref:flavin reductase family protein n=1 Tax=Chitinolyticbacter albus TaxID=2961951 RepID=UPI00210C80A5|nr:flavin reductase family protein [Chitinolyticbacter albus]
MERDFTVPDVDVAAFRRALGRFPTGVTVVTTVTPAGVPLGLTVSSFNSVSLTPPLIVWSLGLARASLPVFAACEYYAVNVLSQSQQAVSQAFAGQRGDPFAAVSYVRGLGNVPVLEGCCATFEVRNTHRHEGGDHLIFVGSVERARCSASEPLVFHGGDYRALAIRPYPVISPAAASTTAASSEPTVVA